ncbi:hypothetical protein VPHK567_0020 [Vibrio phage K567]
MNILEQQFNQFPDIDRVAVNTELVMLTTPCGVPFTTEPMYNLGTELYDHVLYTFDNETDIVVESGEDSFHEAYVAYTGTEFEEIQSPVEVRLGDKQVQ